VGSARRKASTYAGQHNTEKRGRTSMPRAGFEPVIPVFKRSKTVRTLDLYKFVLLFIYLFILIYLVV